MTKLVKAERPESVDGSTIETMTGCGSLYVTLGVVEGKLFETFAKLGKAGGCAAAQIEAICRLISMLLRYGIPPEQVVKQLKGISCHVKMEGGPKSCSDAISCIIERVVKKPAEDQPELPIHMVDNPGFEIVESDSWARAAQTGLCEWDGNSYLSHPAQLKCRNCGRFYRDIPPKCTASSEEADEPDRD